MMEPLEQQRERLPDVAVAAVRWSLPRRCLFRFVFIYFGLYFLPFPVTALVGLISLPKPFFWIGEGAGYLVGWYEQAVIASVKFFGQHIVGLKEGAIVIQPTGSGDTMRGFMEAYWYLWLAVIGTVVWSAIDWKRPSHPKLEGLFRIYLRYALASVLLSYGFAKVPPMQFQPPGPDRLMRTYGDSSPMGLLWTFMGFSQAYTMFAGTCELVPALLLLFRRTATLGGLIAIGVLLNIVLLNFCYDVPVKLYSANLLLAAVVVVMPAWPRLIRMLILNRATGPVVIWTPLKARWQNWSIGITKLCFVALLLGSGVVGAVKGWSAYGPGKEKPALYGLYEVESMSVDGAERPALASDAGRWKLAAVTGYGFLIAQNYAGARESMKMTYDEKEGTALLQTMGQGAKNYTVSCQRLEGGSLVLEGEMSQGKTRIALKPAPAAALMTRGFHWVQEFPYNR